VLVELRLGDFDGLLEVLVRQFRIDDFVAVLCQVGWFDAARNRLPAGRKRIFMGSFYSLRHHHI
jgi:hypothetical protein